VSEKNWHTVFQVIETLPHIESDALSAAFASFGLAKWAALHSELRIDVVD
jgi:hypothetical protein